MYSVTNPYDPLKVCIVGRAYPPEFFKWVTNSKARNALERVAIETEEDFQQLIGILESFNVEVLRPEIPNNISYNMLSDTYNPPPVTPRDFILMTGNNFIFSEVSRKSISETQPLLRTYSQSFYDNITKKLFNKCNIVNFSTNEGPNDFLDISNGAITQVDKIVFSMHGLSDHLLYNTHDIKKIRSLFDDSHTVNLMPLTGHLDGQFCVVRPGLVLCTEWVPIEVMEYYFPSDWEVLYVPTTNWSSSNSKNLLHIKEKTNGRWWVPGEELNDEMTEVVNKWLSNWVGYSNETIFSINMLSIDHNNIIVPTHSNTLDNISKRHNITQHVCNFRHSSFWDGGLHCITADVHRETP